jgi:Uma2 family endonuclease
VVVEVLSPSNTRAKVDRQRVVALSAGTLEFWIVNPDKRTVQITNSEGVREYAAGDSIPLAIFGSATISVDQIFAV